MSQCEDLNNTLVIRTNAIPSQLNFLPVEYLFYLPYGFAVPNTLGGTILLFTAWWLEEGKQILALLKACILWSG